MDNSIENRLTKLAEKVAYMYKDKISKKYYKQLCEAINVCRDYHTIGQTDLWDMYEVVLGEDGIWNYGYSSKFSEEIQDMWALETDILSCNCYLGCIKEKQSRPQDLELQGDNIPEYVEMLEDVINSVEDKITDNVVDSVADNEIDYDRIFDFWEKKICY